MEQAPTTTQQSQSLTFNYVIVAIAVFIVFLSVLIFMGVITEFANFSVLTLSISNLLGWGSVLVLQKQKTR